MYCYTYDNLHRISKTEKGKEIIEAARRAYDEKYKDKPILALHYSLYKMFEINGDRANFEAEYFERRGRLALLQLLAISSDEYISELEDILAAICDEFTWVLPAHISLHPDIDLFSAETSFYLSECVYIFGDKLSDGIKERIKRSVLIKTIEPFEAQSCIWEKRSSNWSAVCACGVGLSYLYLFPERFPNVEKRLLDVFRVYLETISPDGYCEEGIGYWQYGFGYFSIFFDVYTSLLGTRPEILESEKVKNLVQYRKHAQLDGSVYLPYADGGTKSFADDTAVLSAVKNLFGDMLDIPLDERIAYINTTGRVLGARRLYMSEKISSTADAQRRKCAESFYYKFPEVFIRKNENYVFTAKGGHNNELHNHNDVGAFQIVKNQKRLICDLGAGKYTREYFGIPEERYAIFVCNSFSHSVPILNNCGQCYGKEYRAKVLEVTDTRFALDIIGAYDGGADSLKVTYQNEDGGVRVKYEFSGLVGKITFRFVSDFEPKAECGGKLLNIEDLMHIKCTTHDLIPTVERKDYNAHTAIDKAFTIDYTLEKEADEIEFYFEILD